MVKIKVTGKMVKAVRRPTRDEMKLHMKPYYLDDFECKNLFVVELEDGTLIWPASVNGDEPGSLIVSNGKTNKHVQP